MDTGLSPRLTCLSVLLAALTISGCATLDESEHRSRSWPHIGFRGDPDRTDYLTDRDEELAQYCTRHNGFEIGRSNGTYGGVCATLNERAFLEGFNKGKALYDARSRLDSIESEINSVNEKRDQRGLSKEVRDELFEQRVRLEGKRALAREQVERLERETQRL
jgi:uncharacterized protein DUF2799